MSLLADLLSKIKQPQAKREVHPSLKNIVQNSSSKSSANRKIIILSVILIVFVLAGVAALFFVKQLEQSSDTSIALTSPAGSPEPVVMQAVKNEKPEIKTVQTGQIQKAAAPAAGSNIWKPSPKAPRIAQAFRGGLSSPGAWGKGAAQKQAETDKAVDDSMKTPAPPAQKEEKNTKQRDLHLYSAREHELRADYSKALADYKKALEADNKNISIMNSIAYVYLLIGINDASINHSQKALDINNEYVPALTNMGIALAKQNKLQEAEEYFRSAFGVEPENQNVLLNLAVLFEKQGIYEPSADYYGRLTKLGNIEGTLGLARIYEKQGEVDQAVQLYKNAYAHEAMDKKTKIKVRQRIMWLMNN